jgi:hypothetical protein
MKTQPEFAAYPAERFAQAPSAERTRALLFLTGNEESLKRLERHDARIGHHSTITRTAWTDGRLRIDLTIGLFVARPLGRRRAVVFRTESERIERVLPEKIVREIRDGAQRSFPATIDVTEELGRTSTFLVLRRRGAIDSMRVGATTRIDTLMPVGAADGPRFTPVFAVSMELDAIQADTLTDRHWEHFTVVDAIGLRTVRALPALHRDALQAPAATDQLTALEPHTR